MSSPIAYPVRNSSGADQQPGARGGGTARGLVEDLQVLDDGAGAAGALEQGGAHA